MTSPRCPAALSDGARLRNLADPACRTPQVAGRTSRCSSCCSTLGESRGGRRRQPIDRRPGLAPSLFLAHGVTGVRNMNDGTGDLTLELTNRIKRELADGSRIGPPRFLSAGAAVDGAPYLGITKKVVVRTAAEARAAVATLASHGADLIKVYENLSREAYFAIIDEARHRAIPVDGHVPFRITPEEAAAAGQRTVEHPEAIAAGCSTEAAAERKRFAGALAAYDTERNDEKLLEMQIRHYRRALRQPGSGRLRDGARGVPAQPRGGHRRSARLSLHRERGTRSSRTPPACGSSPKLIRRSWESMLKSNTTRELQSILRPIPLSSCRTFVSRTRLGSCCWRRRTSTSRWGFRVSACTKSWSGWSKPG